MAKAQLRDLVVYMDRLLRTEHFQDWDGAVNGLQVQNSGAVTRIAAAVDGSCSTIRLATERKADLLLVHHGLFWGRTHPWTERRYDMLRLLLDHDLAVYSSHLPLDAHPQIGNNARLCAALGLNQPKLFFVTKGQKIGLRSATNIPRATLAARLQT